MKRYRQVCRRCKKSWDEDAYRCPDCGGTLHSVYEFRDREYLKTMMKNAETFWDYRALFPVAETEKRITMGEGKTPLVAAEHLGIEGLFLKNEGMNPSGTFKDRCMSISFSKALELGARGVVIGSAGNAGAAAAAYAARAGIPCYVMVPASTPSQRIAMIAHYGARVIPVEGSVTDCIELIGQVCETYGWHNVTTAAPYNPFQADAEKTIAYEVAKQLSWQVPDWIAVPVGGGGILSGIYEGFQDLLALGLTDRLPRMIAAQETGCNPLVRAFREKKAPGEIERIEHPQGIAVAIADAFPLDGETALAAVYQSQGWADDADDEEIRRAQSLLGRREGIFAESASAAAYVVVEKMRRSGKIRDGERVVCVVTGNGVKELPRIEGEMELPEPVACEISALKRYLASQFQI